MTRQCVAISSEQTESKESSLGGKSLCQKNLFKTLLQLCNKDFSPLGQLLATLSKAGCDDGWAFLHSRYFASAQKIDFVPSIVSLYFPRTYQIKNIIYTFMEGVFNNNMWYLWKAPLWKFLWFESSKTFLQIPGTRVLRTGCALKEESLFTEEGLLCFWGHLFSK